MKKSTILIVDDNHKNLQVLANIIKSKDIDINVMKSGTQAIDVAEEIVPDLILLDVMMPDMNGFEVCEMLKINEITKNIPIIFITAKTATEDIVKGFDLGAVDYITKPVNEKEVIARVNTHLSLKLHRENLEDLVKERTAEIEQERKKAEAANHVKTNFLHNIHHELSTPMNGIIGFNELMRDADLDEEFEEYVEMISSSANTLQLIINDILYFSEIENGELCLQNVEFNLKTIFLEIHNIFDISAREKGLELINTVAKDIPDRLIGDPARIRQILLNLIGNALKFTKKGYVKTTVNLKETTQNHVSLSFELADTGIGMEKEKIDHFLRPFSQLDDSMTRKYGGLGLGLTIAKQLIEMMGGVLTVDTTVGEGTTLYFTIKLNRKLS